jgi:eukaryotic-like serine/threonine-protein kinase
VKQLSDKVVAALHTGIRAPDLTGTRYRLVRYIARGGMGSVWLVEDTLLQRRLALKVLDLADSGDGLAARLLQEGRILACLEHPGIVPVHDAGTLLGGRAFYCMKYIEGQTLAQHIVDKSLPDRVRLLERIAETVDFAHSRGFIHRDLKPENVMIGTFGEVLVMDWGLAKAGLSDPIPEMGKLLGPGYAPSSTTGRGSVLGTPGYMSPEQALGTNEVDHRTDIYSLGAILWFILTQSRQGKIPASSGKLPRPLRAICEKAMAADPDARYQAPADLTADLAHYLNGTPVSAYSEGILESIGRIYRRHSTAFALVLVYLFMRLLFIFLARH